MSAGNSGRFAPPTTMLGIQHSAEESNELYSKIQELHGHVFEVPPINRFHSKGAETKFTSLTGSLDPIRFNADRFDSVRERVQLSEKRTRETYLQAIGVLYSEFLCKAFVKQEGINCAEIEKMFYPKYLPSYADAMSALGLQKPLWWRAGTFASLENISRLPLENCNDKKETTLSFEEWYCLFWNYYTPFNAVAYLSLVTGQSFIPNKEFVDSLADYIAERHAKLDPAAQKNPILFLGSRIGRMGYFLNETKKIPVPVLHVHENPNLNPYLLVIPQDKQSEFKPHTVLKMKNQAALEKYEPSIVLMSDWQMNQDETAVVRAQGSVREYMYLGMQNSYAEGNGWESWGYPKYRPRDAHALPPYVREGWGKLALPFLSRWMIHKNDSVYQIGNGSVTSWMRQPIMPTTSVRWTYAMKRMKPFF